MITPSRRGIGLVVAALAAAGVATISPEPAHAAGEVPLYTVTQEGLTVDDAAGLAKRAGVGLALRPNGSFSYAGRSFAKVPSKPAPLDVRIGKDEDGRRTVAQVIDRRALRSIQVMSDDDALARAGDLFGRSTGGFATTPRVDHTTVEIADAKGLVRSTTPIDTTVTYGFDLGGIPVVGPGAQQRVSFDQTGAVVALSQATRTVEQTGWVPVISPDEALAQCVASYGEGVKQREPQLAYYAPPLSARKAGGAGSVQILAPHYVCDPVTDAVDDVPLTGRLIPAAPTLSPQIVLKAAGDGRDVSAAVDIQGGQAPYVVRWSSSSTKLPAKGGPELTYSVAAREKPETEALTVTVTDANGIAVAATVGLPGASGDAMADGTGGVGGAFASVGIEQTVDEWQCAQDSANGFSAGMRARGHSVNFDWRGWNAFERDFRRTSAGGDDANWVDSVDAQWYTGHGSAGGFTFKSSVDDTDITPSDARWGDNFNLEWMQLESCQVLRDTNGFADYFARWAPAFDGLHVLNGFDTNANCIGGGTGRRFADYLFPENFLWWEIRAPQSVSQAWARMADDLEPSGVRWRSISPIGPGGVHNLNDRFWGQGTTGPDIFASQRTGFIAISGVS